MMNSAVEKSAHARRLAARWRLLAECESPSGDRPQLRAEHFTPWKAVLALLEPLDYGFDFHWRRVPQACAPLLCGAAIGAALSQSPQPLRTSLRRLLLRAMMLDEPAFGTLALAHVELRDVTAVALPLTGDRVGAALFGLALFPSEPAAPAPEPLRPTPALERPSA